MLRGRPLRRSAKPSQAKQRLSAGRAALAKGGRPPRGGSWQAERRAEPLGPPCGRPGARLARPARLRLEPRYWSVRPCPGARPWVGTFAADAAFMPGGLRPSAAALKAEQQARAGRGRVLRRSRPVAPSFRLVRPGRPSARDAEEDCLTCLVRIAALPCSWVSCWSCWPRCFTNSFRGMTRRGKPAARRRRRPRQPLRRNQNNICRRAPLPHASRAWRGAALRWKLNSPYSPGSPYSP